MMSWLLKQLNRIPQPYRLIVFVITCVAVLVIGFTLASQIGSCQYDKSRKEFQEQSKVREARISQLEGENAQLRERMAELEPKALAFTAIVDSNIKVDEGLKDRIEKVTEDAANAESIANQPAACRDRAARICSLFRATDRNFNCAVIYADCPPR